MEFGLSERAFMRMDLGEIMRYRKAQMKMIKNRVKEDSLKMYQSAILERVAIATALNGDEFPSIDEFFPKLYPEEAKRRKELEDKRKAANFIQFAQNWNKRLNNKETSVNE